VLLVNRANSEIRGEVTDAEGKPVITSVVTVLGEADTPDEANEVTARIAARRDEAIAKMVAGQRSTES